MERLMMGGQFRNVKTVYVQEEFDHQTFKYDLAVVELSKPAQFSDCVESVTVSEKPVASEDLYVSPFTFTGWGRTSEEENTTYKLKYNTFTALSTEQCKNYLGDAFYDGALCFKTMLDHSGACFGDYGGPAAFENIVYGVASYTFGGACGGEQPDVFVDVGFFHDWVEEKLSA